MKTMHAVITLIGAVFIVWFIFGGHIGSKSANDAIDQYNATRRGGSVIEMCIDAGKVSAAYLLDKNDDEHRKW
ncbi:MAG: hypothetical protein ACOYNZ_00150 [Rhodoferax sp.]